ncbi:hypothetical protein [Spirosoma aerolatum]|uniref:hypothetical protein n=1 Tax=Spirosoma aerolatum TaxID=1211326 RepID=UPI0009AE7633|nr:hypothetical protein [Spirosoma aerolatum]
MRNSDVSLLLLLVLVVSGWAVGKPKPTLGLYFPDLTYKMGLKDPELKEGEYEVRIWQKCELCFGEAHELYLLKKTRKMLKLSVYTIHYTGPKFKRAKRVNTCKLSSAELWNQLIQKGILTLPDQSMIDNELHPKHQKDSTWTMVEADGTISVHARKTKSSFIVSDGESYYFETISSTANRMYMYSNPYVYFRNRPDIVELKNVVAILDKLKQVINR